MRGAAGGWAALLLVAGCHGAPAPAPTPAVTEADVSGLTHLPPILAALQENREPTPSQWGALFATPGYRTLGRDSSLARQFRLAFRPDAATRRDSLIAAKRLDPAAQEHWQRILRNRDSLLPWARSLGLLDGALLRVASRRTAAYLPKGARLEPLPPVSLLVFGPDGYGIEGRVLIDIQMAHDFGDLPSFLAHELHHLYVGQFSRFQEPEATSAEFPLVKAIGQLQIEGIADRIDKPYPLRWSPASYPAYATEYNAAYQRSPAIFKTLDSLLSLPPGDSATMLARGRQAQRLLPFGSHPNGHYMADIIVEALGHNALMATLRDPFTFAIAYNEAAKRAPSRHHVFSPAAMQALERFRQRYVR